jgi:flagellar M-ring protein FliF
VTGLAVVALIFGAVMLSSWASRPSYVPLFSNLAASDASAITDKLNSRRASFKLTDGGQTILVPQKDVYQLRLDMSKEGLPTGGVSGYSLLDKQGITTSEFQQNVDYKRAIEGELTKTISSIDGVQAAVVQVVIPRDSVFTSDEHQPTASVMVRTAPNKPLGPETVQAIVHLVAASVEGLTPQAVTVVDASGKVLSAPGEDGQIDAASSLRASQTAAFEQRLASSVQDVLAPVVGSGHAVVRVNADLDFDSRNTQKETYVGDGTTPPLSEGTVKETYEGSGGTTGGVLGPDNIAVPSGAGGTSTYSKEQNTRNNAVGRVVEQIKSAPGQVNRLSVAVLLDEKTAAAIDMSSVQGLVANAAGIDTTRGDSVQVSVLPFDTSNADEVKKALKDAKAASDRAKLMNYGRDALIALIVIAGILLGLRRSRAAAVPAPLSPDDMRELEEARRLLALTAASRDEEAELALPAPREPLAIQASVADEIGDLVERQPEEVAQLLRGWLADRRS